MYALYEEPAGIAGDVQPMDPVTLVETDMPRVAAT